MTNRTNIRFYRLLAPVLFIAFGAQLLASCEGNKAKPEEKIKYTIPDSLLRTLVLDTVKLQPYTSNLALTGMVDFDQDKQVNIFSLVSGNVKDIRVQLGDYVTAGQVLAIVKSSEMAGYSNNLVIAETTLKATKKQLDATNDLYNSGLASVLDVTNAQVAYDQAASALETAKKILKINSDNVNGEYVIRSPINGFLVQKNVTNNTTVRPDNGANLFTISDLKDVWVQANVYEANIEKVHIGDSAQVKILSEPDKVFRGKIDKILNVLDPASKVVKVRVVLQNPEYILKPQMYASVVVSNITGQQALCIPASALVYETSRYFVLVYKGKGDADITPVEILNKVGDKVYLKAGVNGGETIIASNALQIYSELNN